MPGTDWPVEQLREYKGKYPAPADFKQFWKKAMDEVSAVKIEIERSVEPFKQSALVFERVRVTAADGCVLSAKYIHTREADEESIVVQFHDYPMASRSWFHLSRYASIGYQVLAPDMRGQAGESEAGTYARGTMVNGPLFQGLDDEPENMYLCKMIKDALLWIRVAKEFSAHSDTKLTVYGEGQGGGLALICAALYPEIEKCAAHYPMLCDYYRVWEKDYDQNVYEGLRYYFRWFDPLHKREEEVFHKLSYFDAKNFAPMIAAQTLVSTGLLDTVSPPSAQFAVVNLLECPKKHLIYPKHGHELNNFFENEYLKFLLNGVS